MAKASLMLGALNGGEWSPMLDGRTDIEGYSASAYRCVNYIPTIQGPIVRRAGTGFIRQAKGSTIRLVPFVKSRSDAVMIEFGDVYCRFYVDREPVVTGSPIAIVSVDKGNPVEVEATAHGLSNGDDIFISGVVGEVEVNNRWFKVANATANTFTLRTIHGDNVDGTGYSSYTSGGEIEQPYEIVSPYSAAAIGLTELGIDFAQRGDVMYITDRSRTLAPRKLVRSSATSWAFSELAPNEGPWQAENATATTMYASAATGSITITASSSVFTAADVGTLIRLDQQVITSTDPWKAATAYTAGDYVRSEGHEYVAATTATSGGSGTSSTDTLIIPSHTSGTVSDGGVDWTYVSSGYGIARITAQAGTTATATVLTTFPQTLIGSGNASVLWRKGAWRAGEYPATVTFFGERLAFGGGLRLDLSVAGAYEDFAVDVFGEVLPENAVSLDIPGPANDIVGLQEGKSLLVFTEGGEYAVGAASGNDPFGPNNVRAIGQTSYGARGIAPVRVGASALYVQASGKRVRSMEYSWESESFVSPDMSVRADHIVNGKIFRMARQEMPHSVVWCLTGTSSYWTGGGLVSFTFDQNQAARAWARMESGDGNIKDVAVIPSPDGTGDDVWIAVFRSVNSGLRLYIEYMRQEHVIGEGIEDAAYCDSGLTYFGTGVTRLYGFDHLEGETVGALIDGAAVPDIVVSNGEVVLPYASASVTGSTIQVGLRYESYFATNRINGGAADGTAHGKTKRITDCVFRVYESLGGNAGPDDSNTDPVPALTYRAPSTPMGSPPALFSGDALIAWPSGYETDGRIWFSTDALYPSTIIAIMPQVVTQEAR